MKEKRRKNDLSLLRRRDGGSSVGVFDIGSNSVRFVAYDLSFHPPLPFYNDRESCALGRDLEKTGRLSPPGMKKTLKALQTFIKRADTLNIGTLEAVATAAVRDAADGRAFADRLGRKLDLPIRILSGEEEALLSAFGVVSAFPDARGVIADLGGGSLELATIGDGEAAAPLSLPLGVLRLSARREEARIAIAERLAQAGDSYANQGTLYAIGGTWRAFAETHQASIDRFPVHSHGYRMDARTASAFAQTVAGMSGKRLIRDYGADKKRAEFLPFAALLLDALLEKTGAQRLIFSNAGLRDGLIYRHAADGG